ncbi:hypothetical protein K458DRAFT_445878 [Lentithecium fluviatile CBS 122367]|uniref:Uncharacterized protein n=1 Tax=Lentithecium fluviatile CBS 122367 TaxID=1168545 RepID=A0A6G1IM61_9PLEO|nr:hypothetical protein K458DRAFT_445878 [Lentithecium fluviatile CBS 122367]
MAAPANKSIKDLNGKWVINKALSDSTDPILALQGVGWLTRKAVGLATVTQHCKQYQAPPDDAPTAPPVPHIDIEQSATGGVKGTTEKRCLDWEYRSHSDWLFGELRGKSRITTLARILEEAKDAEGESVKEGRREEDAKFLAEGWLEESKDGEVVESFADAKSGWTGWQVWGFSDVKGERWLTRRFAIRRKDREEVVLARLVYEWVGEE